MLKLRLKRCGRKKQPSYRLVIMTESSRRDGRFIDQVGFYNTITKQSYFDIDKINQWLEQGVKPTDTVKNLLIKANIIKK
uniref:Small ribosomal subunit protein bS16c n=1 Tax=Coscinodiscus granii TaxID=265552 RepID=A0A8A6KQI2_9STRA|nr:ribosomal protein S16 [Coscinodiscus granii]QTI82909.1 ribosomal protein S16 [Coscinodiscus granii]